MIYFHYFISKRVFFLFLETTRILQLNKKKKEKRHSFYFVSLVFSELVVKQCVALKGSSQRLSGGKMDYGATNQ